MRRSNNLHTTSLPIDPWSPSQTQSKGLAASADLVAATVKLFDGLRDHPDIRKIVFSILDAEPEQPKCPTCGHALDPGHKLGDASISGKVNKLPKAKHKKL